MVFSPVYDGNREKVHHSDRWEEKEISAAVSHLKNIYFVLSYSDIILEKDTNTLANLLNKANNKY